MRKILLLLFFSILSGFVFAQQQLALCISMRDGSSVSFLLNEKPRVTFVADSVKIVSSASQIKVKRSEVIDVKFKMEMTDGIEDVGEKGTVEIASECVRVGNVEQGCVVNIYSIDGCIVASEKADENGLAVIPLNTIPVGVYLLNYNDMTVKFIRR